MSSQLRFTQIAIPLIHYSNTLHSVRDIWRHVFRKYTPCETENMRKDSSVEYVRNLLRESRHVIPTDTDCCLFLPFSDPTGNEHRFCSWYALKQNNDSLGLYSFFCNSSQWARASSFTRFLDHTQRRTTVGRTRLGEWLARRGDLYLTTRNTQNRQTSMPPVGLEPTISAGERPQTYALDRAATGTGLDKLGTHNNQITRMQQPEIHEGTEKANRST